MPAFLVDASLPRDTASLIMAAGYHAIDVRAIGMGTAPDQEIAFYAQANGLCIITRDLDFSNIREYPPEQRSGVVVIRAPEDAGRVFVLNLVSKFLQKTEILERLPGRLAIVSVSRIRLKPA